MTIANTHIDDDAEVVQHAAPLPIGSLFALALAAFVTILTEALPPAFSHRSAKGWRSPKPSPASWSRSMR